MKKENKLLFTQCYDFGSVKSDYLFRKPKEYRDHLLNKFPNMKEWIIDEYFEGIEDWPENVNLTYENEGKNIAGRYIQNNINTYVKVIDSPIKPETLLLELKKDDYTHVGFSLISNDYTNFLECTKIVKQYNPAIKTIVGGPGALKEDIHYDVDYHCKGDGIKFLRHLFGEDELSPYKITIIPDGLFWKYLGNTIPSDQCKIITRLGCPLKCDFCVTNKLFDGFYSGDLFTPKEVHDKLVDYMTSLKINKLQIFWAEPTSVWNFKWWYELFDLFKEDDGDYCFFVASPSIIMDKLNLNKISDSAARIGFVNIGIESFNKNYIKNSNIDMKKLIKKLFNFGISTYVTYIIGFDFDTKETIWNDVKKLVDLDADMYSVLNLNPISQTEIWNNLKAENRLFDIPYDFYILRGFQSFKHPYIKPGFEDLFPLLCKIYRFIETEKGNIVVNLSRTMQNLLPHTSHPKIIRRDIKIYKSMGKAIYPAWNEHFNPNPTQKNNYLSKINN